MLSTENREMAADIISALVVASYEALDINEMCEHYGIEMDQALAVFYEVGTANVAVFWDEDIPDPLAHITAGDEDPLECEVDEDHCRAAAAYFCTRLEGHPGQHIAGDGYEVLAVWDQ